MRSFRDQFVKDLARELAELISSAHIPVVVQAYEELLNKRLPGALEVMYPMLQVQDQHSRR
jgi:hypothetical protein